MKPQPFLIAVIAVVVLAAPAIYKWVDEEGRVHYSDQPPPDVETETVETEPAPAGAAREAVEARTRAFEEARKERAQRTAERDAKAASEAARRSEDEARAARCAAAREQLIILQEQRPVYRDESGNLRVQARRGVFDGYEGQRDYLEDAEREALLARARDEVEMYCVEPDSVEQEAMAREQWLRSQQCATARAELAWLEEPRLRTPESELKNKRAEVRRYCGE